MIELQARVNHTFEMEKLEASGVLKKYGIEKASKGKRDEQYQWAAKAYGKAMLASGGCKPATSGKDVEFASCDLCWALVVPYPCNCVCPSGFEDLLGTCWETCSRIPGFSHDSGGYCHKPCDREEQLSNTVGCGFGHARN